MGKLKCAQYWPDGDKSGCYGDIMVTVNHYQEEEGYDLRHLIVQYKVRGRGERSYYKAWFPYVP